MNSIKEIEHELVIDYNRECYIDIDEMEEDFISGKIYKNKRFELKPMDSPPYFIYFINEQMHKL